MIQFLGGNMIVLCLFAGTLFAQPANDLTGGGLGNFVGIWYPKSEASTVVDDAINKTTKSMNVFSRGIARDRLRQTNTPPKYIRIKSVNSLVTIEFAGRLILNLPLSGNEILIDDRKYHLELEKDSAVIRTVAEKSSDKSKRVNQYRILPGRPEKLSLEVTISHPNLPGPLNYTIEFTKTKTPG